MIALASATFRAVLGDEVDAQLAVVAAVAKEGAGSDEARRACGDLSKQGAAILPKLLDAMDTDNIVAANWLRTVYESIIEQELSSPTPQLPVSLLQEYARDSKRQGRVRRLVLATLDKADPKFRDEFIPACLDDSEFRSDAVDEAIKRGDEAKQKEQTADAVTAYEAAFSHARDSNQVTLAADKLAAVGKNVDIVEQMGLVVDWYVLGPFDAPEKTGFTLSFPPEQNVDLNAEYDGKGGGKIRWKRHRATDRMGLVNLVQAIAPASEAVGYAYAELDSKEARAAQLRCGADDNLAVWLNGERVFAREQWLNGIRLDRFITPVELKQGTNRVLVKICQGPQHSNAAVSNNWTMQLRLCTPDGASAGLTSLLPPFDDAAGAE